MIDKPLPEWLKKTEKSAISEARPNTRKSTDFVERTIIGITTLIGEALFAEKYVQQKGLLQARDACAKIFALFAFLLAASMAHRISTLVMIYLLVLVLAVFSRIPLLFFLRRVWFFIPFYSGIVSIPAIFSFITPGKAIAEIGSLVITEQGVNSAATLVLRVGVCVSIAVLLVLTTKWQDILRALQAIRLPYAFILTAEMTYRYIFLLIKIVSDMHLARKSRMLRPRSGAENREWVSSRIAVLFRKSQALSEQVYLAMLSRGYSGNVGAVGFAHIGAIDYSLLAISVTVMVTVAIIR